MVVCAAEWYACQVCVRAVHAWQQSALHGVDTSVEGLCADGSMLHRVAAMRTLLVAQRRKACRVRQDGICAMPEQERETIRVSPSCDDPAYAALNPFCSLVPHKTESGTPPLFSRIETWCHGVVTQLLQTKQLPTLLSQSCSFLNGSKDRIDADECPPRIICNCIQSSEGSMCPSSLIHAECLSNNAANAVVEEELGKQQHAMMTLEKEGERVLNKYFFKKGKYFT